MVTPTDPDPRSHLEPPELKESGKNIEEKPPPSLPRLFRILPRGALLFAIYPGLLVVLTIAMASTWLSQHYGAPVMLFALLFGMAFHFLHSEGRCIVGIDFATHEILRTGIALLGVRVTVAQLVGLGVGPLVMVMGGVATTIIIGWALARWLGLSRGFGVLSGGSVAICGASAALAIAAVLPKHDNSKRDTILVVVVVTTLSTIVMILYPLLVAALQMDHVHAGIFLGGTIHDVAQVVGAGYMVSPETGDIATYVKLLRVAMLLPVVLIIGLVLARKVGVEGEQRPPLFPLFLLGFAALVAINSFGLLAAPVTEAMTDVSRWFLVTAIAGLGMKTSFKDILAVGWRPIGLMVAETMWIAALVLVVVEFWL
ncbi:MAG: putative sulfate exporter family transporter [Proteobacteria bacterium]|nr:putative sulfate exporter family transporter [Pseudomonadota bacterium]